MRGGPARTLLILLLGAGAVPAGADSVRLRRLAGATGPQVRLAEVALLDGQRVTARADLAVGQFAPGSDLVTLSLDQVRAALAAELGNIAAIDFGGHADCRVDRRPPDPPADVKAAPGPERPAPVLANAIVPVDLRSAISLRALLETELARHLRVARDELEIELSPRDQALLAPAAAPGGAEFRPSSRVTLGRVAMVVEQQGLAGDARCFQVRPIVRRRVLAVVATDRIRRGATIGRDLVEVREVLLDQDQGPPIRTLKEALGAVARCALQPGAVLHADDLRPPLLVRRRERIAVRCLRGALSVKASASAEQDGSLDEVILVRADSDGGDAEGLTYRVRITGPREAVTLASPGAAAMPGDARPEAHP